MRIILLALLLAVTHASAADRPNILFLMGDDWSSPHASILGDPVVKTPSRCATASGQFHWRLESGANLWGSLPAGTEVYAERLQKIGYFIGHTRKGGAPSRHEHTGRDPFGPKFKNFKLFLTKRKPDTPFCFWFGTGDQHPPYKLASGIESGMDPAKVVVPACLPDNSVTRADLCDYFWERPEEELYDRVFDADLPPDAVPDHDRAVCAPQRRLPLPRPAGGTAEQYRAGRHCQPPDLREAVQGGRLRHRPGGQVAALRQAIFVGDNGTAGNGKGQTTEMGCRVPFIACGPGMVKATGECRELVDVSDVLPTICEVAGIKLPKDHIIDGVSFAPYLRGETKPLREWIYAPLGTKRVARTKRWLLENNSRNDFGRLIDCGDSRDGTGYKDVTDSMDPEVEKARKMMREILADKPVPTGGKAETKPKAKGGKNKRKGKKTAAK